MTATRLGWVPQGHGGSAVLAVGTVPDGEAPRPTTGGNGGNPFNGPSKTVPIYCGYCGAVENYRTYYRDSEIGTETLAYHSCEAKRAARRSWFDRLQP